MDIRLKASGGKNIVLRPQARAAWYPSVRVGAASVGVWWRYEGESWRSARFIGRFSPGAQIDYPVALDLDRNIILSTISYSARGIASVRSLKDAVEATIIVQRETEAPVVGQVGEATTDRVSLGIDGFTRFARERRVRISPNADMSGATEIVLASSDYSSRELPRYFDLDRGGVFTPDYTLNPGDDPLSVGWAKTGAGTVGASGGGWQINTQSTNLQTFYTKSSFPTDPFEEGFTLVIPVPSISAQEVDASAGDSVAVRVRNATKQFNLSFDATNLVLNGSDPTAHGGAGANHYLVVAAGGATASVYVDGALALEDELAVTVASGSAFLRFGDLETTNDGTAIWAGLKYQLSASVPQFPQTIYVTVAHSGGNAWTPESEVLELSFADDAGAGGTVGVFNPVPRDKVNLNDLE
jgi:hypothetical protein